MAVLTWFAALSLVQVTAPPGSDLPPPPPESGVPATTAAAPGRGSVPPPPLPSAGTSPDTSAPATPTKPVDLSRTWSYAHGPQAQPRYVGSRGGPVLLAPNPMGFYSGVSLEGNHVPPRAPARLGTRPALLTWTGFSPTTTGTRVFFEVTAPTEAVIEPRPHGLAVRLPKTRLNTRNNGRNLDLRYFATPVRSVRVVRQGKDLVALIELKDAVTPVLSTQKGEGGYDLIVLEFPGQSGATTAQEKPES